MGMGSGNKKSKTISEINVTPFVDVMLVLLVIFMVTAPLMLNGIKLNLPKTKEVNSINLSTQQVILSFSKAEEYYIGEQKYLYDELINVLKKELARTKTQVVYLRADYAVKYGLVAKLVSYLKNNELSQIALVTEIEK